MRTKDTPFFTKNKPKHNMLCHLNHLRCFLLTKTKGNDGQICIIKELFFAYYNHKKNMSPTYWLPKKN